MATVFSPLEFWHSPARQLLAYPSGDGPTLQRRWAELQAFQLDVIYAHGPARLAGLDILGVGYCGVVLRVRSQGGDRVLKVRREPAPQLSFETEATLLQRANTVAVGPQYVAHSDNFLLMDYIDGPMLVDWLQSPQSAEAIQHSVSQLIHQAYRLDQLGLDHGDLRCITAHALMPADSPVLIDFSRASAERRPANVTTLVQGLFISTEIAQLLRPWFPNTIRAELIEYLRRYKHQPSWPQLNPLLAYLGIQPSH